MNCLVVLEGQAILKGFPQVFLELQDLIILTSLALENSYDMCGDINVDGMLNILDIVLVIGIIVG